RSGPRQLLGGDHRLRAVVLHHVVRGGGDVRSSAVGRVHPDDVEGAGGRHAGEAPAARADGQLPGGFVPGEGDGGVLARLVVVRVALVLVEREGGVSPLVDADLQRVDALGGVLNVRTHGNDGAPADVEGDR